MPSRSLLRAVARLAAPSLFALALPSHAAGQGGAPPPSPDSIASPAAALVTGARAADAVRDGVRVTRAVTIATSAPVIDGRLDDAAWRAAPVASGFTQREPRAGEASRYRTEVRVLHDAQAIYIGVHAHDPAPDSIGRQLARRDPEDIYSDWINVGIDSFRDRRTAFVFALNPRGVQADWYQFNDTEEDPLWDAVWIGAAQVVADGWIAEFRIPLSQLRYSRTQRTGAGDLPPGSWGFNISREVARDGEVSFWSPTPPDQPGIVSRFGTLAGLDDLGGASALELIPYLRTQGTTRPATAVSALTPANAGEAAAGLDLRYRLPRNLTLSATVNPDFGQVEADPAVVNLTQFEVFFPERRPFFLEGFDAFNFGGTRTLNDDGPPNFFYTRRIGRAPVRGVGGGAIAAVDRPTQTGILGAAKVSGKTPGGWSVGALLAATRAETARLLDTSGTRSRLRVEPPGGYGILRLRKDLRGGNTVFGGITTLATRDAAGAFASLLAERSLVAGIDFEHAWANRTWAVSGVASRSVITGDRTFITRLQRAPYRLYQRPDADHLGVDPTRAALPGHFVAASVAKTGGTVVGSATYEETSPGFETNDLGFQQRADFRTLSTALLYRSLVQGERGLARAFRSWEAGTFNTFSYNFAGDRLATRTAIEGSAQFANFWTTFFIVSRSAAAYDDRLTRGGPLARLPERWRTTLELGSDSRRAAILNLSLNADGDPTGRRGIGIGLGADLRPTSALRIRVSPELVDRTENDQYLATVDDPTATATFGRRHVFGIIDRRELNLTTRVDWTWSPTLSLQLFVQPFAAAGHVRGFRSFARPRAFEFAPLDAIRDAGVVTLDADGAGGGTPFTIDEPDFRIRSLRGNAVVRWEFRPGSALFLVWQQQR
ncbi:MAG: carbohydrate binding family 9 domain-containing protein, partial [Gemmatimonadaceae bacterium]|nr:carbohydrate binding family 9 domain-containing protein [Gemmatimonadaceae bacterium]